LSSWTNYLFLIPLLKIAGKYIGASGCNLESASHRSDDGSTFSLMTNPKAGPFVDTIVLFLVMGSVRSRCCVIFGVLAINWIALEFKLWQLWNHLEQVKENEVDATINKPNAEKAVLVCFTSCWIPRWPAAGG